MKAISNNILQAINTYKFPNDIAKPVLDGVSVQGDEIVIADGLSLHVMKNREDTELKTVLSGKDLKVAQKGINKKELFSLMTEGDTSVVINGVRVDCIGGKYPDYKQILQGSYKVLARVDIKKLINLLQVLQKLGAGSVDISISDPVKPLVFRGLTQFGGVIDEHVVSLLMPMMKGDGGSEIDTSKVKGVQYEEPKPVERVSSNEVDPLSEDLPF